LVFPRIDFPRFPFTLLPPPRLFNSPTARRAGLDSRRPFRRSSPFSAHTVSRPQPSRPPFSCSLKDLGTPEALPSVTSLKIVLATALRAFANQTATPFRGTEDRPQEFVTPSPSVISYGHSAPPSFPFIPSADCQFFPFDCHSYPTLSPPFFLFPVTCFRIRRCATPLSFCQKKFFHEWFSLRPSLNLRLNPSLDALPSRYLRKDSLRFLKSPVKASIVP